MFVLVIYKVIKIIYKMQYPKQVIEQRKQLQDKLIELNKLITKEDRRAYIEKFNITQGNLSLYMNGKVYDLEKALQMVEFFKERIHARKIRIQSAII